MRALVSAVAFVFILAMGRPGAAQDFASSVVGVWKLTGVTRKEIATGKTTNLYGEHPTGHLVYTRGGHVCMSGCREPEGSRGAGPH